MVIVTDAEVSSACKLLKTDSIPYEYTKSKHALCLVGRMYSILCMVPTRHLTKLAWELVNGPNLQQHCLRLDRFGTAMQLAGGPHIPLRYGRTDAETEEQCAPEGRLPGLFCILRMLYLSISHLHGCTDRCQTLALISIKWD